MPSDDGKRPATDAAGLNGPDGALDVDVRAEAELEKDSSGYARRTFLQIAGFGVAASAFAGCHRAPTEEIIPYLVNPEEVTPGLTYSYATLCGGCSAGCGLLTRNRDGRPLKIEGNDSHPVTAGGVCTACQATTIELYDSKRLRRPRLRGKPTTWTALDQFVSSELDAIQKSGGKIRLLTDTVNSPTLATVIATFGKRFPGSAHVMHDPRSVSAIPDAHKQTHGVRVLPRYGFARAKVIVGIEADFLGDWFSPVEHTRDYAAGRTLRGPKGKPKASMSYHAQLESRLSVTGAKADRRIPMAPGAAGLLLSHLAKSLAGRAGGRANLGTLERCPVDGRTLRGLADRLWRARGRSLVVCGGNDVRVQVLVNYVNHLLGNYGGTIDIQRPSRQRLGNDAELKKLVDELRAGQVSALLVHGVDPLYHLAWAGITNAELSKVKLLVSFDGRLLETASVAHAVAPDHHFLEAWRDAEATTGVITTGQPAVAPLGKTRSVAESLARWSGQPKSAYTIQRTLWEETLSERQQLPIGKRLRRRDFWDRSLHEGWVAVKAPKPKARAFSEAAVQPITKSHAPASGELALVLYAETSMGDGRHAHNPLLQELPDPISKVVWDNCASLSPATAKRLGVSTGDVVRLSVSQGGRAVSLELPALVQPGQHDQAVAVALGYGRKGTDRFANIGPKWLQSKPTVSAGGRVGGNAAGLLSFTDGTVRYSGASVRVTRTSKKHWLVRGQKYHSQKVPKHLGMKDEKARPIALSTTLGDLAQGLKKHPNGAPHVAHPFWWPRSHKFTKIHWGMVIDLSACTGCGACAVSCQVENNIPVVGKDEVDRYRDMQWMRIDRYFAETKDGVDVVHQPMLCQHCDNAPCESVCPVLATMQSSEGINQQIYNRCVGTRYCANNCPYKVRRFNWFEYSKDGKRENMALNPDVTVRSRGVMEKCSFCIQRIQEAKANAKRSGKPLKDGDVRPACAQSCPARAITFGNVNDPKSAVSMLRRDPRYYVVLGELNTEPSVGYLKAVRNRPASGKDKGRG